MAQELATSMGRHDKEQAALQSEIAGLRSELERTAKASEGPPSAEEMQLKHNEEVLPWGARGGLTWWRSRWRATAPRSGS